MLVDMLSKLILIHSNSIGIQHNWTTDVFQGPVEDLNKVTEKIEKDLEDKADDYNDESNTTTLFYLQYFITCY